MARRGRHRSAGSGRPKAGMPSLFDGLTSIGVDETGHGEGPHVHHRGRRPRAKPRHLGARRARQGRVRPVPPAIDAGAARSARSTDACGTSQLTHENSRSLKKNRKRPFTVIAGAPFIFCFSWPFHPIPIPTRRGPRPRYHSIRRTATGENNELVAFGRSARWNPLALLTHSSSERDFGKRP